MAVILYGEVLPAAPDYPVANAGWYPLHPKRKSNYGIPNQIVGLCIHTPEEPSDDIEVTPRFFRQDPAVNGSSGGTHYYHDSDGDVVQMCRDLDTPHAQGVRSTGPNPNVRLPRPDIWKPEYISYNCMFLSTEVEGEAHNLHLTMIPGRKQWKSLVDWCAAKCRQYGIPVDRKHILGHWELATDRTDPGKWFQWDTLIKEVKEKVQGNAPIPITYTVQPGDILSSIANKFNVKLAELVQVNNIANANLIRPGQELIIPGAVVIPPKPPAPPVTPKHAPLTQSQMAWAGAVAAGWATVANDAGIVDAKIQPTNETSGGYEVHRLLVKRK